MALDYAATARLPSMTPRVIQRKEIAPAFKFGSERSE